MKNNNNKPLINYNSPIYDPFRDCSSSDWMPGNPQTAKIIHLSHIFRDIHTLFDIIAQLKSLQQSRLIGKYIIVESISLDEHLKKFANSIIDGKTEVAISDDEKHQLKEYHEAYKKAREPYHLQMKKIRDKLGAHRDPLHVTEVASLWSSITTEHLTDILNCATKLFDLAKDLDIYSWLKEEETTEGKITAFSQPGTYLY